MNSLADIIMEIENLCKEIRSRAFERKDPKTPEQVGASWYNDDLTYDGVAKTLYDPSWITKTET